MKKKKIENLFGNFDDVQTRLYTFVANGNYYLIMKCSVKGDYKFTKKLYVI